MLLEARLRAFAAFARRRSFSAAAAELRISQPVVSKHIADLERALGLRLVERVRRDGALTSAGEFVANHVLRAESLLVQATLGAAEIRKSGSGSLAIVASWLTGTYLLPEIIAEFKHSHPGVHVSLELGTAKQAVECLRSHRAELGFIANAVGGPEIEAEPLLENEIVIVGRPALVPKRLSREAFEALTWISREEGSATRSASERAMPRRRLELPSYEAVLSALKRGYGVAAISRYVVAAALRAGSLTVVPVRGWNVRAVISVLRVRDALLTPSANQFQALVRDRFVGLSRERPRKHR
jgi:LysR family transcriptional regulator, transcriptional activator of the cysJI operon